MGNDAHCSECGAGNVPVAHFCSQCGEPLDASPRTVGRVSHPAAARVPEGYGRCNRAADLYFRAGSAWGGARLSATENLGISIFNAGHGLQDVVLVVPGVAKAGNCVFEVRQELAAVARRAEVTFEVPSYELSDTPFDLRVELASAEYDR